MAGELPKGLCPIDAVGAYKRPASVQGWHAVCCAPLQVASNRTDPTLDQWLAGRGKPALEYTAEYQQVAIAPPAPATACLFSPEGSIAAGRQVLGSHLQRHICSIVDTPGKSKRLDTVRHRPSWSACCQLVLTRLAIVGFRKNSLPLYLSEVLPISCVSLQKVFSSPPDNWCPETTCQSLIRQSSPAYEYS